MAAIDELLRASRAARSRANNSLLRGLPGNPQTPNLDFGLSMPGMVPSINLRLSTPDIAPIVPPRYPSPGYGSKFPDQIPPIVDPSRLNPLAGMHTLTVNDPYEEYLKSLDPIQKTELAPEDIPSVQVNGHSMPDTSAGILGTLGRQPDNTSTHIDPSTGFGSPTALSLLAAGLGILANNTGHYGQAGPAIGLGGLQGINTFMQLQKQQQAADQVAQEMALKKTQSALYAKQVEAQTLAQERANRRETTLDSLIERQAIETDPEKKKQLREEIMLRVNPAHLKDLQAKPPKDRDEFVTDANGQPVTVNGQQLWRRITYDENGVPHETIGIKSGMHITNTVLPENKAATVYAGESAKRISALQENSQQARESASQFRLITDTLKDYKGGAWDVMLAKLGDFLPAEDLRSMKTANDFAKGIQQLASKAFKLPGSVTEWEQKAYLAAVPSLIWTQEGRELATQSLERIVERNAKVVDFQQRELMKSGSHGYVPESTIHEFSKSLGPLFTSEELKRLRRAREQGVPKAPAERYKDWGLAPR